MHYTNAVKRQTFEVQNHGNSFGMINLGKKVTFISNFPHSQALCHSHSPGLLCRLTDVQPVALPLPFPSVAALSSGLPSVVPPLAMRWGEASAAFPPWQPQGLTCWHAVFDHYLALCEGQKVVLTWLYILIFPSGKVHQTCKCPCKCWVSAAEAVCLGWEPSVLDGLWAKQTDFSFPFSCLRWLLLTNKLPQSLFFLLFPWVIWMC